MHERVKVRETEMNGLIDQVFEDKFLSINLDFEITACLDLEKLTVSGHSMGGATALRVGHSDRRVKCILTHDPWLLPVNKEIFEGTLNGFTAH